MSMHKYAQASKQHAQELAASLTNEDIKKLAATLEDMGLMAWIEWKNEQRMLILHYVEQTPAKRNDLPSASSLRLLVYACIEHCWQAYAILDLVSSHEYELSPGGSYRNTTAKVGSLFPELLGTGTPYWNEIFDESICPPPFYDEDT